MFEDLEEESSRKMSGVSRVKSMNVVVPAGNKAQRSPGSKPIKKAEKSTEEVGLMEDNNDHQLLSVSLQSIKVASLPQQQNLLSHSIRLQLVEYTERVVVLLVGRSSSTSKSKSVVSDNASDSSLEGLQTKRRCAWVTTSTDRSYAIFHDEEWGVPVHDDKEVFANFDLVAVSKLNEKKILAPGSTACSLLSELKLRAVIENARQVSKIPISSSSSGKDLKIGKDLVRRGFRGVGPTVVYSFMQVAGILSSASDFRSV
ncbi:hypothetical protein KY285_029639 [Solanum tuberosum]|nr:hypothetical protein KY285_029639 [Solanum tuberosum]